MVMKVDLALYTLTVCCMDDNFNLREDVTRQLGGKDGFMTCVSMTHEHLSG